MPPHEAARLVEVLAQAVHAAHEQGVVHRGLRPACIRLAPLPEGGSPSLPSPRGRGRAGRGAPVEPPFHLAGGTSRCLPKIGDFGLARRAVEGDAADVELHETAPSYLAPEQAWGRTRDIGPCSDIYALGTILYELLTGRPPFRGRTPGETLDFIRGGDPPSLHRNVPGLPGDLAAVCRKAMQRNPRNRYRTALEFADDLRAFLSRRPVQAWKPGVGGRLALWTRRRPLAALLLLVCLLAPIGLLIAYSVGAGDASSAKEEVDNANRAAAAAAARTAGVQRDVAETRKREQQATYLHYILLADRELREGEAERARQLLADCPADQRDWEWRYLNYRTNLFNQPEYLNFEASAGPVSDVAFSPDGRWLAAASGGANPEVVLWQPPSTEAAHVLTGFRAPIRKIAFSPDGRRLAVACSTDRNLADWTGDVSEWNPAANGPLQPTPLALGGALPRDLAYSPDGKRLLVVDDLGMLHAFAAGSQVEMRLGITMGGDWNSRVYRMVVLNSEGTKAAVIGGFGQAVQIYDLQRGGGGTRAAQHQSDVMALAFSPETNLLASASRDGKVIVWDVQANRLVATLQAHVGAATSVSFTRDGHRLATAGDDGRVRIWDPATGQEVYELTPFGAGLGVTAVQFSPAPDDGRLAAAHGTEVRVCGPARP